MIGLLGLGFAFRLIAGVVLSCALVFDFYAFKHIKALNQVIALQEKQIKQDQDYITYYANLYARMKKECQLDKEQIIKRYSLLLQEINTPIPQIGIPKQKDQCKAMQEMIDEASNYFNK